MRNSKRRHKGTGRIRIVYAVFLVLYSLFTLLDAFVIPRNIVKILRGESKVISRKYKPLVTDTSYDDGNIRLQRRSEERRVGKEC